MNKLTPLKKQAKRAQRAFYTKQCGSWNGLCPVTKRIESGKTYCRAKSKRELLRDTNKGVWPMKRFLQEYDEDVRHRKKSKTSKTSKSVQRSNHKHEYEKVIIREFIGYAWGGRCRLCAKFPDVPIYEFSYEDVQYHFVPQVVGITAVSTPAAWLNPSFRNKTAPTALM